MGQTTERYFMEALAYPHHTGPVGKCFVRRKEHYSNEEDQCINEHHVEENKGDNIGKSGSHQILINSVDLHLQFWGTFRSTSIFDKVLVKSVALNPYANILDAL